MTIETFKATDETQALSPKVGKQLDEIAFDFADKFIDAGQSTSEATSIVAHLLIRSAWKVAGTGRVADGHQPDPERFRSAVNDVLEAIYFPTEEERAALAQEDTHE